MGLRCGLFLYLVGLSTQLYVLRVGSTVAFSQSSLLAQSSTSPTSDARDGYDPEGNVQNDVGGGSSGRQPMDRTPARRHRRSISSSESESDPAVDAGYPRTFLIDGGLEPQPRSQRADYRSVEQLKHRGPLRRQLSKTVSSSAATSGSGIAARSSGASDGSPYVRHRFTPWGGKRGVGFQPWGGKRDGMYQQQDAASQVWPAADDDDVRQGYAGDDGEAADDGVWLADDLSLTPGDLDGRRSAENEGTDYDGVKRGFHPWGGKRRRRRQSSM